MEQPAEPDEVPLDAARQGIVLSATGGFYVEEALRAARSSLRHNGVRHVVFADVRPPVAPAVPELLELARFEPSGNPYVDKIANMRRSPFERTIFLDSDTWVVDEIVHVLDVLEHYDVAVAFAPAYRGLADPVVPKAFHEFNTGVLAWRRGERTEAFLDAWQRTYESWLHEEPFPGAMRASRGGRADQPAFRRCAWEHGLAVFVLTPEYNLRLGYPTTVIDRVRVIHGEHRDPDALAARVNARQQLRSWPPPLTPREKIARRINEALGRGPRPLATPRRASRRSGTGARP